MQTLYRKGAVDLIEINTHFYVDCVKKSRLYKEKKPFYRLYKEKQPFYRLYKEKQPFYRLSKEKQPF